MKVVSKAMKDILKELDWEELRRFDVGEGTEWIFTPANAPWHNGCSEALIKSFKKALEHSVGNQILSFSEFQTVCYEASNMLNERPIGRSLTDPCEGAYLCPNDLLLGKELVRECQVVHLRSPQVIVRDLNLCGAWLYICLKTKW